MRTRISRVGFYLLCALMSPVILVGYLVWVGRLFAAGRSGVSATAQGPLSARFSEHNFGTRYDEAADRLMRALPGVPRLGLRMTTGPVLLAHRGTGYVPRAFRYPFEGDVPPQYEASARIWFFDAAVDRYLPDVAQFVILVRVSTPAPAGCRAIPGCGCSRLILHKRRWSSARRCRRLA